MRLIALGMNHKTAPVATREAFAIAPDVVPTLARRMLADPAITEVMLVSTCNRVECYAVAAADTPDALAEAHRVATRVLTTDRGLDPAAFATHGYAFSDLAAARHLIRVCSSLDSLVVGEAQILAQVRESYQLARQSATLGPVLERTVQAAFRGAKAVRTDTAIASETVSIGSVAAALARRIFPALDACQLLLIGAGKIGRITARSLARHGVGDVIVTNRSPERALALATEMGWSARSFADLDDLLVSADVVITCTGAERPLLTTARLRPLLKRRKYRPLFLIDIAVPRDIDPQVSELEQVYLYDIDNLESISRDHLKARQDEAQKAEALIEATLRDIATHDATAALGPTIQALRERAQTTANSELQRAFARQLQHLASPDRDAVSQTVNAILNKLLHPTLAALREHMSLATTPQVFDLLSAARVLNGLDINRFQDDEDSHLDTIGPEL